MRYIKCTLLACVAAALWGCSTTYHDPEAAGTAPGDYGYTRGSRSNNPLLEGPNAGVNTNYFGPVNAGAEAARGPGTTSGNYDHVRP